MLHRVIHPAASVRGTAIPEPEFEERPLWVALRRGWHRRCPHCGAGPMMRGYLQLRETCPVCGEDLRHHRLGQAPAYLTLLVVGQVLAAVALATFSLTRPDPLIFGTACVVLCVALGLFLLPRIKGVLVGLQWARRMHGFGKDGG